MLTPNYYTIDETLAKLGRFGLTLNIIGSYVRERLIHPIVYINAHTAHACEHGDDGSAIAVGHCFVSCYWDLGQEITAIIDSLISSPDGTIEIRPLVKKEMLIGEPLIFDWQYDRNLFQRVPPGCVNPKPHSSDLNIRYFILTSRGKTLPTLKLSNILIGSNDFDLLKKQMTIMFNGNSTEPGLPKEKSQRAPKKKTNPFKKLVTELHRNSESKTPEAIWTAMEKLCHGDVHPILQEVTPWDQINAEILWQSHRGEERHLKRRAFENMISELNNPK